MIWLTIDWNIRECWINTIPKDSTHSGRVLKFDKICFGNKYIEVRLGNCVIKIPTQQCIIEEENINRKSSVYYEYE
jgi:hypothetical protein